MRTLIWCHRSHYRSHRSYPLRYPSLLPASIDPGKWRQWKCLRCHTRWITNREENLCIYTRSDRTTVTLPLPLDPVSLLGRLV